MTRTQTDFATIVQEIYAAFQRGDIAFVLSALDPEVQWEAWDDNYAQRAGVPWLVGRTGPQGAAEFFSIIGRMKFHDFRVLNVLAGGNEVAGVVEMDAEMPDGGRLRDQEMHLFTFNAAGKVVRFRHYLDTAKHIEAARR
jgi:ketosteroid isomerase-like protein